MKKFLYALPFLLSSLLVSSSNTSDVAWTKAARINTTTALSSNTTALSTMPTLPKYPITQPANSLSFLQKWLPWAGMGVITAGVIGFCYWRFFYKHPRFALKPAPAAESTKYLGFNCRLFTCKKEKSHNKTILLSCHGFGDRPLQGDDLISLRELQNDKNNTIQDIIREENNTIQDIVESSDMEDLKKDDNNNVKKQPTPKIYLRNMVPQATIDYANFNFPDSTAPGFFEGQQLIFSTALRFINFGTNLDAKTMLFVLRKCYENGYETLHIFAHSRGGGAFIRAWYMLQHPEEYSSLLKQVGYVTENSELDTTKINKTLAMIQNGKSFLAQPWLDPQATFRYIANKPLRRFTPSWVPTVFPRALSKIAQLSISAYFALLGNFDPFAPTALTLLPKVLEQAGETTKVYLHADPNDNVIGGEHIKTLARINAKNLELDLVKSETQCVHGDTSTTLNALIAALRPEFATFYEVGS